MSNPSRDVHTVHPDEALPEGAVVDGETLERELDESFDFVVVGSGASGAVAAHVLAAAGHRVAIVEEGRWIKTREFGEDLLGAFRGMVRDSAMQAIEGRSFLPLLQGRCVGGSTVINSAIAWRTPEDVLVDWARRFGLSDTITPAELEAHFVALERELHVSPVGDEVLGENNRVFLDQMNARGLGVRKMHRYDKGCRGSGRCLHGCPHGAKQGMNVTYVPRALGLGARIFTSCRVDKVTIERGVATGVIARTTHRDPWRARETRVRLRARLGVVLAASTVQTPVLLQRSGVRRNVGEHFQIHPGLGLAARFDHRVQMDFGATQGVESVHFRETHRFKLETISMPPELAAARIPGVGQELVARLADYGHVAVWAAQIRAEAEGTVRPAWGGGARVKLTLSENDMRATRMACAVLAETFFAAGAREVWPGIHGVPSVLRSADAIARIAEGPLDPRAYSFIATHLFGAARMGPDPRSSAVGLDFATHEARRLYVVDSSLFPTNLGVNPQHSIMGIARLAATRIAERAASGLAA